MENVIMKKEMSNKGIYIPSIEASTVWEQQNRGRELEINYDGMLPYSLFSIKLNSISDFKVKKNSMGTKLQSMQIINIKFNSKVKTASESISDLNKVLKKLEAKQEIQLEAMQEMEDLKFDKIQKLANKSGKVLHDEVKQVELNEKQKAYKDSVKEFIAYLEQNVNDKKYITGVSEDELRKMYYRDGFKITFTETIGKGEKQREEKYEMDYCFFGRSSAKSRNGECLFIQRDLYEEMIQYSRMDLPFTNDENINNTIDLASLLAYETLVGSGIESTIKIKTNNILMIDDMKSVFEEVCNVVKIDKEKGRLVSVSENATIENDIWDGQSLLDSSYFEEEKSMKLLRNHFFKSAAFNTDIKKYFEDYCEKNNLNYDTYKVKDMFDNSIKVKDIHLIITPNSAKFLKFSSLIGTEKEMYAYWKKLVKSEGATFGVCKSEKASKRGTDFEGNIVQQMSYQMINSLDITEEGIENLLTFEKEYVSRLKEDDEFFINYLSETATTMNSNEMFVDIYKVNPEVVKTSVFHKMRIREISDYVKRIRKGKIRLNGDYCVMVSNPLLMLKKASNEIQGNILPSDYEDVLKGNQMYTKLFDQYNEEYVAFRNPHTAQSNVGILVNTKVAEIDRYFNFGKNIVVVSSHNHNIMNRLNGCDYDSDCIAIFSNKDLLNAGKECYDNYKVAINSIAAKKKPYTLSNENIAEIDIELAKSTDYIGQIVNGGQHIMSVYWDKKKKGKDVTSELEKIDITGILSGIAIDMAKKFYAIDMKKEIEILTKGLGKRPLFFGAVTKTSKTTEHNTPMDYVFKSEFKPMEAKEGYDIELSSLLKGYNAKNSDSKQYHKMLDTINATSTELKRIYAKMGKEGLTKQKEAERDDLLSSVMERRNYAVKYLKVNEDTMIRLIKLNFKDRRTINTLYQTHGEVFLNSFKGEKND